MGKQAKIKAARRAGALEVGTAPAGAVAGPARPGRTPVASRLLAGTHPGTRLAAVWQVQGDRASLFMDTGSLPRDFELDGVLGDVGPVPPGSIAWASQLQRRQVGGKAEFVGVLDVQAAVHQEWGPIWRPQAKVVVKQGLYAEDDGQDRQDEWWVVVGDHGDWAEGKLSADRIDWWSGGGDEIDGAITAFLSLPEQTAAGRTVTARERGAAKLAHLTSTEIEDLMRRYYDGETSAALVVAFHVDVSASSLVTVFPPLVHADLLCPYCAVALESKRPSKSSPGSSRPACPECGHATSACRCQRCVAAEQRRHREFIADQRKAVQAAAAASLSQPVSLDSLGYRERVLLGALLRTDRAGDGATIPAQGTVVVPFSPSMVFTRAVLKELYTAGVLAIDPESNEEAFDFTGVTWRYYIERVRWLLNVDADGDVFEALAHPSAAQIAPEADAAHALWREVALQEALQYLRHQMAEFKLEYTFAEPTERVIADVLRTYSTAQAFNLITRAVKDAAALVQSKKYVKPRAINTIPGHIQRAAERYAAQGWDVYAYRRNFDCPQTVLSSFLYDRILGIGDRGFTESPGQP